MKMSPSNESGRSLVVGAATFLLMFLETGMIKSLGLLLPSIREQFATKTWVIGFSIALVPGFGTVICLCSGAITKVLSPRWTIAICGFVSAVGLIGCSLTINVYTFAVSLAFAGFSTGTTAVSIGALSNYFDKHYDIAVSSANCGTSLGIIIMPVLTQFCLDVYGWRGTTLLRGGITLNVLVCSLTFKPPKDDRDDYHPLPSTGDKTDSGTWYSHISDKLDMHLFTNLSFVALVLTLFGLGFAITGWLIYIVQHVLNEGFTPYRASAVATTGGIGCVVGNCIYPVLCKIISIKVQLYIGMLVMSAALVLDTVASAVYSSYTGMVVCSIFFGLARGLALTAWYGVIHSVVQDDSEIINALSWTYSAYGLASTMSGFSSGWFFDIYGSYTVQFIVFGVVNAATLIPQCIVDIKQLVKKPNQVFPWCKSSMS